MGRKTRTKNDIASCTTEKIPAIDNLGKIFSALLRSGMFRGTENITDNCFTLLVQPNSASYIPAKVHVMMNMEGQVMFSIDINDRKPLIGSKFMDIDPDDAPHMLTEFFVSRIASSWLLYGKSTGSLKPAKRK